MKLPQSEREIVDKFCQQVTQAYDTLLEKGLYISPKVMSQAHFNWIKSIQSPFAEAVEREATPL